MRHMLRIDKGCAPMRSEGSSQFDSWIQFVRTYDDCHYIHTVPPKKTAEADEAEIGHFKDSSCSNQPGTCDIDDAMMLSPLELRIMMGDHPLHMVFPPC